MDSEDEQCNLEALEALIEDSDNERMSENHENISGNNSQNQSELDLLAGLMNDDSEFEELGSSQPSQHVHAHDTETSATLVRNKVSDTSLIDKVLCCTPVHVSNDKDNLDKKLVHVPNNKDSFDKLQNASDKSVASVCSVDPMVANLALQEEMAKLQQKMFELQKQLAEQQQKLEQDSPHSYKQRSMQCQPEQLHSDQNIPPNKITESRKVFQNCVPGEGVLQKSEKTGLHSIRLLSDSDDCLFSQSVEVTSSGKKVNKIKTSLPEKASRDKLKKDLFGDSDSDWEMDSEDKQILSEEGRDIQQLLKGQRKREAHEPKFAMSESCSNTSKSWTQCLSGDNEDTTRRNGISGSKNRQQENKNTLHCKSSSNDQAKPAIKTEDTEQFITENFSKIRIVNPLISSSLMKLRMEGRKMINVSRIRLKLKTPDLQSDWVTIAVIVGKTDSKSSSTGKPYCIWKLNDLEDLDNSVSFFLFGEVHKQLWKTEIGTVIGVLNPSIMESMEKNNSEPAFTIKNPSQLMVMGRSKDLSWCTGRTKAGNKCNKYINKKFGNFCAYHVQAAYRKVSASRLEFHGSIAGIRPKSFERRIFSKDCAYMYGGQTFVPNVTGKPKTAVTLNKLQDNMKKSKYNKVNTMSIHDIKPLTAEGQKGGGRIQEEPDNTFIDMISVPSPGSMNLVAFLKNKEKSHPSLKGPANSSAHASQIQSITPKELIKQHQQLMQQKRTDKRKASDQLLVDFKTSQESKSHDNNGSSAKTLSDPLRQVPILAKGFYKGQDVNLDVSSKFMSTADRAKMKAVLAVRSKGGLKQEDPNATKRTEPDADKIRMRVQNGCDEDTAQRQALGPRQAFASGEPPKKKSRLLGSISLDSEEIKNIMKARSKHRGALAEAEAEREETYFNELEKKEKLEEKLQSVTSIEITVTTCKQCLYTAQSAKDSCKQEGHTLTVSKAKKRFFMCKKCKHRTYIIGGKFPTEACRKCGAQTFEKTSMYKVKEGPKLESEVLNIRGDEIKYLNSMDQKIFLQTVVDH